MSMLLYDWRKDPMPQHTRYKSRLGRLVYSLAWFNIDSYLIAIACGTLLFYLPKSISTVAAIVVGIVLSLLFRLVKNYYGVSMRPLKYKYASTPITDIVTIICIVLIVRVLFLK